MPTYEFECGHCGHKLEVVCSFDEVVKTHLACPRCSDSSGQVEMRRLITGGTGFVLHGPTKDWPSKAGRLLSEDKVIQRQRRKAFVLKGQKEVPQDAVIGLKEADQLYDKKHTEGELDKLYKSEVQEGK